MGTGLHSEIPVSTVHLCIDMQRLFAEDTAWHTPSMSKVLPSVEGLCAHRPERTCFTRFIPPLRAEDCEGTWRRYWERWGAMTLERLEPSKIELVPELARFVPPAHVLDKHLYSPWLETTLHADLRSAKVDTLVVSGGETDVCVLAAVLGAVDLGYRVIVVTDALCSGSDEDHDRLLALYHDRYSQQIETAVCSEVCDAWQ